MLHFLIRLLCFVAVFVLVACTPSPPAAADGSTGGVIDAASAPCPTTQILCGATCVSPSTDESHCGGCGRACAPGQICVSGLCAAVCASGQTNCDGVCRDTASSPSHCGRCGNACAAGEFCNGGTCANFCSSPRVFCGTSTCTTLATDVQHCGGCNHACPVRPNMRATCASGTCGGECLQDYSDCDSGVLNGCEVNTSGDVDHCGACGAVCRTPHGTPRCALGSCTVGACETGYGDCDGSASTGCEVALSTDPSNCGRCGAICSDRVCNDGRCEIARTCLDLHTKNPRLPSGIYVVDPDGLGTGEPPFDVYCEMDTLDGGWTLIQRTVWDWNDNRQLVTNQADWYATGAGTLAPGRAFRMAGRLWPLFQGASPRHLLALAPHREDAPPCAPLYYQVTGGTWSIAPPPAPAVLNRFTQTVEIFARNLGDRSPSGSSQWSTTDVAASASESDCIRLHGAVPWAFVGVGGTVNCCATCPTFGGALSSPPRPMANYLSTPDALGNTVLPRCGGVRPTMGGGFYLLDSMEYYVR